MRGFAAVLPVSACWSVFLNRGFPTFLLGDYPQSALFVQNSRVLCGSLCAFRADPALLPGAFRPPGAFPTDKPRTIQWLTGKGHPWTMTL